MNITSSSNDFMAEWGMTLILHRSLAVLGIDGYTVPKIFARNGQQPYTKNDWGRGTQSRSTGSSRMCQQLMGNMKALMTITDKYLAVPITREIWALLIWSRHSD